MKFNSKYENRHTVAPEMPKAGSLTEQTGYVPPKVRIEEMFAAGRRLNDARKEQYDSNEKNVDVDDIDVPVTRMKGVDFDDVLAAENALVKRMHASRQKKIDEKVKEVKEAEKAAIRAEIEAENAEKAKKKDKDMSKDMSNDN